MDFSEKQSKTNQSDYSIIPVRKEPLLNSYRNMKDSIPLRRNCVHPLIDNARPVEPSFPSLREMDLVRHYHRLAKLNFSWEDGLYPLGSCTMKYNPIINEVIASKKEFAQLHPFSSAEQTQGALEIIYETESMLAALLDMPAITLTPAAGAHGELIGTMMIRAWFREKNEHRKYILIPDSAHGTNPASAAMAGFAVKKVQVTKDGLIDMESLRVALDHETAALMLTNPNTMGIFESDIGVMKEMLDKVGALLFMDGANLNAIVGRVSLSKMGVDLTQLNLHKTFSTPHGGGGPGQGALACSKRMIPFLPPRIVKKENGYEYFSPEKSIGHVKATYGQFANIVRAWVYLKTWGNEIDMVSGLAVLNSTYLRKKLEKVLQVASPLSSLHETVFTEKTLKEKGLSTKNLAKALLDRGFYAPTVYFPLNVPGAIMVEPTETESKEEMDAFAQAVADILSSDARKISTSPHNTVVREIDDVGAARKPCLTWQEM